MTFVLDRYSRSVLGFHVFDRAACVNVDIRSVRQLPNMSSSALDVDVANLDVVLQDNLKDEENAANKSVPN